MSDIKYPDCVVALTEGDGNIYSIIGRVRVALRRYLRTEGGMSANAANKYVEEFTTELTSSGSYDEALVVVMKWVTVE